MRENKNKKKGDVVMRIGTIVKTKLGLVVIMQTSTYGTAGMRCLLVHRNSAMHRTADEVEVLPKHYAASWGALIVTPKFVEEVHGTVSENDLIVLTWLLQARDDGYHYEVWGPHPLPKFRSEQALSWNPINIPSVFNSLNEMEA